MAHSTTFTHALTHANHLESPTHTSASTSTKNSANSAKLRTAIYNYISKEYIKKMGEINIYDNFILKFENKILSHVFMVALCSLQCTKK